MRLFLRALAGEASLVEADPTASAAEAFGKAVVFSIASLVSEAFGAVPGLDHSVRGASSAGRRRCHRVDGQKEQARAWALRPLRQAL